MTSSSKYLKLAGIFFIILILSSCIKQFTPALDRNDSQNSLVVEGMITDETGPFKVHLTQSGPVDKLYSPVPYNGADVTIIDDNGNSYQLIDNQNGWYETEDKNLKGAAGTTYTLKITDVHGNNFESTPELMLESPDIDSIYTDDVKHIRLENGLTFEDNWLNILIDTKVNTGLIKYLKWDFVETWEISLPTKINIKHGDPLEADSRVYYKVAQIKPDPEKKDCWVTMPSSSINIKSIQNNIGSDLTRLVIQSIGPGEDKLCVRYSILVKQYSVNKNLFNYWGQLKTSNENAGGIFNVLPAPVFGNIKSISGEKKVVGYFSASQVKKKRIFINSSDHHINTVSPYDGCLYLTDPNIHVVSYLLGTIANTDTLVWSYSQYCVDCRAYGTNVRPDFW